MFDYTATDTSKGYIQGQSLFKDGSRGGAGQYNNISEFIPIESDTNYTLCVVYTFVSNTVGLCLYDANYEYISGVAYADSQDQTKVTFNSGNAAYMRFTIRSAEADKTMLTKGSTAPTTYTPFGYKIPILNTSGEQQSNYDLFIGDSKLYEDEYVDYTTQKIYKLQEGELTPTDPPLPLPSIITYDGENAISSTETLGDVEFTGEWTAIMGSTEDESIDIEFTVDAEEYIAFVTVDDEPSIQVSDTITMPASASSFTLQVVSWGRERYTDTVYNALS